MSIFPQSVPNLTEASTNLYELVKGANLIAYRDDGLRLAVHRAVARETTRGWRIAKGKSAHRIDVVVALAQAAMGAVKGQTEGEGFIVASNLATSAVRRGVVAAPSGLTAEEAEEVRAYQREFAQRAAAARRRELTEL